MLRGRKHSPPEDSPAGANGAAPTQEQATVEPLLSKPSAPAPEPPPGHEVFLTPEALAINEARLCHLASLGLDLAGKQVLEVGGGIGLHTCFFESLGCEVTFTEGRPENLQEAKRRYPHRKAILLDLDHETDLARLGMFDVIYCYGTLYHLSKPAEAVQALAAVCREMLLLETCITPGDQEALHPEQEPATTANQAASGLGCRPTRPWVLNRLKQSLGYAYHTRTQPRHPDFELNWLKPSSRKLYRAVFVGARHPLNLPTLSEELCDLQNPLPREREGVWLDVGAHLGETTFEQARQHPGLKVYAFEPNLELAAKRFDTLSNYTVIPMAVSDRDGFVQFRLNANSAASSLLPFEPERLRQWVGGEDLKQKAEVTVPTIRLDSALERLAIAKVDYLKIDTQGADFSVVLSAGERLADIRKIKLEVTVTPTQLYRGAAPKQKVVSYLASKGFALVCEQSQTHGQEENLIFFKLGSDAGDIAPLDFESLGLNGQDLDELMRALPERRVLSLARSLAQLRPLQPWPGWTFGGAENSAEPSVRLRHALWKTCWERKLKQPILFPWYDGLQLNLYLGNDMSRPTYIGGCIEPNEFVFMGSFLKPGMVMVDVGANDGFFTVFAARRVGEAGRVYAFEPSQREFGRLQANLALNHLRNVQPVAKAVAEAAGQGMLRISEYGHEGQNTLGSFAYQVEQAGTEPVELCCLDDYFANEQLARLDFIKIDVEGAEHKVLTGARKSLSRYKPVILLELLDAALRHQGASAEAVVGLLKEMGYRIYDFAADTGRLRESDTAGHSDNIVACFNGCPLPGDMD